MIPATVSCDAKSAILRQHGVLHTRPQDVVDPLFRNHEFFDPRDLIQVKYEMLRRVRVESFPVVKVAATFGFSRPAFYQAQAAFRRDGLTGLIPQRPGPRHAHKLSGKVLDFLCQHQNSDPKLSGAELAELLRQTFGWTVHARTIERALSRHPKKGR